jgi:UDP-2,3-diacylglucosamine hydrolase
VTSPLAELALPPEANVLFASDMHLGEHDPHTAGAFLDALTREINGYSHLVLLGDLFEVWAGDDQQDYEANRLVQRLRELSDQGVSVAVMRGNRDFLLDVPLPPGTPDTSAPEGAEKNKTPSFTTQTGASLLADACVLTIGNQRYLLMHGDSLCTDDTAYQEFRETCRAAAWQQWFLQHSLSDRMAQAQAYRQASKDNHQQRMDRSEEITDVAPDAVDAALDDANCNVLIHGHTHRPARHQWQARGVDRERLVLPDWHAENGATLRGGFFRLTSRGVETVSV